MAAKDVGVQFSHIDEKPKGTALIDGNYPEFAHILICFICK